jgi:DNA-binding IclR family transcriptional regulator
MKTDTPKKSGKQKSSSSAPIVDSLATALSLLNYFTTSEPELSLVQLCEKSGLYKSRIHRLCGTLVFSGFLVRMPWASYRLGPKLMALGKIYETTNTIISTSRPLMKELAASTGESVALFGLDGNFSFCLAREYGASRLVFAIQEGDNMHLHASAAGRVLLSYGSEELRQNVLGTTKLERFTPLTIVDPKIILEELAEIKRQGYAVNKGERELEVAAIAAPIFNHEMHVTTSLAMVGPAQRFTEEFLPEKINRLLEAARSISLSVGASF